MQAFTTHSGRAVILDHSNIDTDQIISKEHLKSIKKTGFGPSLFSDWRYLNDGSLNTNFELNQPACKDASILITGNNFGCGSSREHAVWALVQYGFKIIIAPSKEAQEGLIPAFADIFKNNAVKNGLLLIDMNQDDVEAIKKTITKNPLEEVSVDLKQQTVGIGDLQKYFEIDPTTKERLLKGLDDIGITLSYENYITEFEKTHSEEI